MEKTKTVMQTKQELKEQDYLDLWKWFTEDAAKIKDRMWAMATFFYTALGGLLGFVANNIKNEDTSNSFIVFNDSKQILIVAIFGCLLSLYGIYMLKQYGEHVRRGWNRANDMRSRIEGFDEIWNNDDPKIIKEDKKRGKGMPKIIRYGIIPMAIFFLIFSNLGILILL